MESKLSFKLIMCLRVITVCLGFEGCQELVKPVYGDNYIENNIVTYTCKNGYGLIGSSKRYCLKGRLTSSLPACVKVVEPDGTGVLTDGDERTCVHISASLSGTFISQRFVTDKRFSSATIRILMTRILFSRISDYIHVNGKVCEKPRIVEDSGDLVNYEYHCSVENKRGHNNRNKEVIVEIKRKIHSKVCEIQVLPDTELFCPLLNASENDVIITYYPDVSGGNVVPYGTAAKYSCEGDSKLNGNEFRHCIEGYKWSGEQAYCKENNTKPSRGSAQGCSPPVVPYLGRYTPLQATYKPNDLIHYSCNNRSHSFGSKTRICKPDGMWNQDAPYCSESLHGVSVHDMKWNPVLDGQYSSCIADKSISLLFNHTESFSDAIVRVYSSGNITPDIVVLINNSHVCDRNSNNSAFHEFNCSFQHVTSNTAPNITVVSLSKAQFCEIEIYTAKAARCSVLTKNANITLRFEPAPENGYVSYGTAAIHGCNDGYQLVGEYVRYCIDDNQWSGQESYCEIARRSSTTILTAIAISTTVVIIIGIIVAVFVCKKKCKREKSVCNMLYSECDDSAESPDKHCYSTIEYDTVPEGHRKPLPEIPSCEMYDYTDPVDAKAESLVGNTYSEVSYDKCCTVPVTTKTGKVEVDYRSIQNKRRAKSLYVKSLQ